MPIHDWSKWRGGRAEQLTEQPHRQTASRIGLWVTRDPIKRYVSAFHSKIQCCPSDEPGILSRSLRPCMGDKVDGTRIVSKLLHLNGNHTRLPCLPFHDYVDNLLQVYFAGLTSQLDEHMRPQYITCGDLVQAMPTIAGDVNVITTALQNLVGYGLKPMPPKALILHRSNAYPKSSFQPDLKDVRILCTVAASEYTSMSQPLPPWCILNSSTNVNLPDYLNHSGFRRTLFPGSKTKSP